MRFGLLQAAHCPPGVELSRRYLEVLDEAVVAEEAGFDFYSVPEQHFNPGSVATTNIPASEVLLGAVAARTTRIRLIWLSAVLPVHHPIRVAEAIATLDLLSSGRTELCTARSNDLPTMRAFEVDPSETTDRWRESIEIIARALSSGRVEHAGRFWNIPDSPLNPLPIQAPPPLLYASTSVAGHELAGSLGLGVVGGNSLPGGWDYVAECVQTYRDALEHAHPVVPGAVNRECHVFFFVAHCSEDVERAKREAASGVASILGMVNTMFSSLAPESPNYRYMDQIRTMYERRDDLDFLIDRAPYISIGDPQFFVERIRRLEEIGADSVVLRVDGMPHEVCVESIRMFGEHVIPAFRGP
jgi:alkanesulfonate monooxygenase SsuD/methylene tetrahydromethanopterin reductase-like flavin-dependent oxidoreductase (luciferase family)